MNAPMPLILVIALALCACSRGQPDTTGDASPTSPEEKTAARPAIDAQEMKPPCEWLTTAEIASIYGPLTGEPRRVGDAENWGDDQNGEACAYPVSTEYGAANLVVQLDLTGAPGFEAAEAMMQGVIAQEMPTELGIDAPAAKPRPQGWDFVGWVAGIRVYRVGHLAILMNITTNRANDEPLDRVASLFREKILDKPFSSTVNQANLAESSRDPCDLITRAEAESVLGKLSVEPYRSWKSAPVAHGEGPSCSYYAPGHRVFRVRPVYFEGKERFEMAAGLGGLVRSNLGGADEGDLLDGPWDSATSGTAGDLLFLQGDTMLQIFYATSSAEIDDAAKLAAIAMPRAVKISANP